jgi:hypothetical protein
MPAESSWPGCFGRATAARLKHHPQRRVARVPGAEGLGAVGPTPAHSGDRAPLDYQMIRSGGGDGWVAPDIATAEAEARGTTRVGDSELPLTNELSFAVFGTGEDAVLLHDIRIVLLERRAPTGFAAFYGVSGSQQEVRRFAIDFTATPPRLASPPPSGSASKSPAVGAKPEEVNLRVARTDPEVISFKVDKINCDCTWVVDFDWVSPSGRGTFRVDNDGAPFRSTSAPRLACDRDPQGACDLIKS